MTVTLWLSDDAELHQHPTLALHAARLDESGRAVVTAQEWRRFISAWARNDPNGEWRPDLIVEGDGALVYQLCEDLYDEDRWVWPVVGMEDGVPVYALTGWVWVLQSIT